MAEPTSKPAISKMPHWSFRPKLVTPGSQFLCEYFIEFTPKDFPAPIIAKVFLIEVRPPAELLKTRPDLPATIFGTGFQIHSAELEHFQPAFKVPSRDVAPLPRGNGYRVKIGDVAFNVVGVPED